MKVIDGGLLDENDGHYRVRLSEPTGCWLCEKHTSGGIRVPLSKGLGELAECARCWIETEHKNRILQVIDGGRAA